MKTCPKCGHPTEECGYNTHTCVNDYCEVGMLRSAHYSAIQTEWLDTNTATLPDTLPICLGKIDYYHGYVEKSCPDCNWPYPDSNHDCMIDNG